MNSYVFCGTLAVALAFNSICAPARAAEPSTSMLPSSELPGKFAFSGPSETYRTIYSGGQLVTKPDNISEGRAPMLYRVCLTRLTHGKFHVSTKLLKAEGGSCKELYVGVVELKPKECVDVIGFSVAVGVSDCGKDLCDVEGSYAALATLPNPPCP
jgi:hypothetical protein